MTQAANVAPTARWYIVHAYSGFEKKVAQAIKDTAAQKGLSDLIEEVVVPVEEVQEVRKGRKVNAERKFFPGYVLVKMVLNDHTHRLIKDTPKVTGFVGGGGKPQPMTQAEVDRIFKQMQEGMEHPRHAVSFEVGESVKVREGPFEGFVGVVEGVDEEKGKLKVAVTIFGRATPLELEYGQVEKV